MTSHFFGPILSRRLGRSLGVNLVPKKCCNLDCIYCEVGPTTLLTAERKPYVTWNELSVEFEKILLRNHFDVITLTGMGEPTLNSKLSHIIHQLKLRTPKPIVVLTNGVLFRFQSVRTSVRKADIIMPSLDAAITAAFIKVDRPIGKVTAQQIIHGLAKLRHEYTGQLWLEIMLIKGLNDSPSAIAALQRAIAQIQPNKVQLNTITRRPLTAIREQINEPIEAVSYQRLCEIANELGPTAEIIVPQKKIEIINENISSFDLERDIIGLLNYRPMTAIELCTQLNCSEKTIRLPLKALIQNGKIRNDVFSDSGTSVYQTVE